MLHAGTRLGLPEATMRAAKSTKWETAALSGTTLSEAAGLTKGTARAGAALPEAAARTEGSPLAGTTLAGAALGKTATLAEAMATLRPHGSGTAGKLPTGTTEAATTIRAMLLGLWRLAGLTGLTRLAWLPFSAWASVLRTTGVRVLTAPGTASLRALGTFSRLAARTIAGTWATIGISIPRTAGTLAIAATAFRARSGVEQLAEFIGGHPSVGIFVDLLEAFGEFRGVDGTIMVGVEHLEQADHGARRGVGASGTFTAVAAARGAFTPGTIPAFAGASGGIGRRILLAWGFLRGKHPRGEGERHSACDCLIGFHGIDVSKSAASAGPGAGCTGFNSANVKMA